mgnify:CR=1 FL=1
MSQAREAVGRGAEEARGGTILLTTHFMDEAERLCDRVAIIDRGRVVVADATNFYVVYDPAEPVALGETVVPEPAALRRAVAARAQSLKSELGLSARRKRNRPRASIVIAEDDGGSVAHEAREGGADRSGRPRQRQGREGRPQRSGL